MTLVLTMLAVLAGFMFLMLALDPQRRKKVACGATFAVTAGAFGLADHIPTVGGDALAQPGCHWDGSTLSCPVIGSSPESPPPYGHDCLDCGGGYGEHWGGPQRRDRSYLTTSSRQYQERVMKPIRQVANSFRCTGYTYLARVANVVGRMGPPINFIGYVYGAIGYVGMSRYC